MSAASPTRGALAVSSIMMANLLLLALTAATATTGSAAQMACANTTAQCKGSGGSPMPLTPCCDPMAECEAVDAYYSKCVLQPTCAKKNAQCAGSEGSIMRPTPCCDPGYVCRNHSKDWMQCDDGSIPPPPPPTPKTCARDGEQCGGTATEEGTPLASLLAGSPRLGAIDVALNCCNSSSKCEAVNQYYSKCVNQPKCAAAWQECKGTKDHVMEPTPCCDAGFTCADWQQEWGMCREQSVATCSRHQEQCAGTGGSAMPPKPCCETGDECVKINQWYSKCDTPPVPTQVDVAATPSATPPPGVATSPIRCPGNPALDCPAWPTSADATLDVCDRDDNACGGCYACLEAFHFATVPGLPTGYGFASRKPLAAGPSGGVLLRADKRAYLVQSTVSISSGPMTWSDVRLAKLHLTGKTLKMRLDVHDVGCACNAAACEWLGLDPCDLCVLLSSFVFSCLLPCFRCLGSASASAIIADSWDSLLSPQTSST